MMKKTLLGVGLAVALTIPMGLSVAAAQEVSDDPPVTIVDQDQVRDQNRQHDCDLRDGDAVMVRDQVRDQDRDQVRDQDCELCDGDAVRAGEPERERVGRDAEAGFKAGPVEGSPGVGNGEGVSDGTGPLHDGPENGTGNNRGLGRR